MHEYSVVQALLGRVQQSIHGYDVVGIRRLCVRIGALSGVDGELLKSAYEFCAPGTCCEGAALEIEQVPARWQCSRCGRDGPEGQRLACASCGVPLTLVAGDEIVLEKIDVEVNDV
jgi:hydrogenase nickel incorporation protein HypA/HybF